MEDSKENAFSATRHWSFWKGFGKGPYDAIILRGVYLREGDREKYVSTLTIKPIASKKCQLEIKFDTSAGGPSSSNTDKAAKELFQIIEKVTGKAAQ